MIRKKYDGYLLQSACIFAFFKYDGSFIDKNLSEDMNFGSDSVLPIKHKVLN